MTDEERRSPLHDVQVAAGAEIIWEDGWPWAMTVGDTAQNEYEAIRTATGSVGPVLDREVRGDRARTRPV